MKRAKCIDCDDILVSGEYFSLCFSLSVLSHYLVLYFLYTVKPRAPKNLAIEKAENGNFNLSWEESYSPPSLLSGQPVIYEVKYWRKQHPTEVRDTQSLNFLSPELSGLKSPLESYFMNNSIRASKSKSLRVPDYTLATVHFAPRMVQLDVRGLKLF